MKMLCQYRFTSEDLQKLFYNKCIVIIGDSVMRSMYKDLVLFLQQSRYLTHFELRRRGELSFMGDELIEGGMKGEMTNGKGYREVRQYHQPSHLVRFYFITRVYNSFVETVLADLSRNPIPDVIIMNSCLWDITRYGPNSMNLYKENLQKFCFCLNRVLPSNTLVIWTTAMPVSNNIRGGFLLDHINFLSDILRLDQLMANFFASQVISDFKFDVIDLHYLFRNRIHHRKDDGIHWDDTAHREITNILIGHICKAWGVEIPDRCRIDRGLSNSARYCNSVVSVESLERKVPSGQENKGCRAALNDNNRTYSLPHVSFRHRPY